MNQFIEIHNNKALLYSNYVCFGQLHSIMQIKL